MLMNTKDALEPSLPNVFLSYHGKIVLRVNGVTSFNKKFIETLNVRN